MFSLLFAMGGHFLFDLIFFAITLGLAISFAVRPVERKLACLRYMSVGSFLAVIASVCAGLGSTALHAATLKYSNVAELVNPILQGLAEAVFPAVVGSAVLAVTCLMVAVGLRRQG